MSRGEQLTRRLVFLLLLPLALEPSAHAQLITLGSDHLTIQDASDATRVDVGPRIIVQGEEIRVLGSGYSIQNLINDAAVDASASKPYRIVLGPGVYTLTAGLVMKPWVSLAGSGQEATVLKSGVAIENLVSGADNMSLTDMTIENAGGSGTTTAILNDAASPRLTRITAIASGLIEQYGVRNTGSSSPTMTDVEVVVSGQGSIYGVYNQGGSPMMTDVTVTITGSNTNFGIHNTSSSPVMTNVRSTVSGGVSIWAVRNSDSSPEMTGVTAIASGASFTGYAVENLESSPIMTNVTANCSGGVVCYGVLNGSSSSPTMTGVAVAVSDGDTNIGISNTASSSPAMTRVFVTASGGNAATALFNGFLSVPEIKDSVINAENGATNIGIDGIDADARIYNTVVIGGVANDDAGNQCHEVYDDTPASVGC